MNFENFIINFSYFAIFLLLYTNGVLPNTLNSSQLTCIICGYFVSIGKLDFTLVVLIGSFARTFGNITSYEIIRKYGLKKNIKKFFNLNDIILKKIRNKFENRGVLFILIGKLIPAFHFVTPIFCAISKTKREIFYSLMFLTNLIWITLLVFIGYSFGKNFTFGTIYLVVSFMISFSFLIFVLKYLDLKFEDLKKDRYS